MTKLEIGKVYDLQHSRKGAFTLKVTGMDDEWTTGIIVEGKANAILPENEKFTGEKITVRTEFLTIKNMAGA